MNTSIYLISTYADRIPLWYPEKYFPLLASSQNHCRYLMDEKNDILLQCILRKSFVKKVLLMNSQGVWVMWDILEMGWPSIRFVKKRNSFIIKKSMVSLLDANVILRFLVEDSGESYVKSRKIFDAIESWELQVIIPAVVIAECLYIMTWFYVKKKDIGTSSQ